VEDTSRNMYLYVLSAPTSQILGQFE